jgi:hypothetical protein
MREARTPGKLRDSQYLLRTGEWRRPSVDREMTTEVLIEEAQSVGGYAQSQYHGVYRLTEISS